MSETFLCAVKFRSTASPGRREVSLSRAAGIFVVGRRPSEKNPLGPRVELGLRRGIPICQVRISSWISTGAYDRLLISTKDLSPGTLPYERSGDARRTPKGDQSGRGLTFF